MVLPNAIYLQNQIMFRTALPSVRRESGQTDRAVQCTTTTSHAIHVVRIALVVPLLNVGYFGVLVFFFSFGTPAALRTRT